MGIFTSRIKAATEGGIPIGGWKGIGKETNGFLKDDPDDKWSNIYREREKNHLYKWVDGGQLAEIYETNGLIGVRKFTDEYITPLLYHEGQKLERIRLADYVRWKKSQGITKGNTDESLPMDLQEEGSRTKFQEHMAQWKLNKRGVDGETIVHLLLQRDDPMSSELAKLLLRLYPGMALDMFEGDETYGQTCLHLAVMHDDGEMVDLLLELGADVNQRATGRFFLPEDQKLTKPKKQSDYVGYAYYGEYPLAFAACFGNKDIYDALMEHGADPNVQDSFGNTVLHMCVISNSIDMYGYAMRHSSKPANPNLTNVGGFTPLTLSSRLGRKLIFEEMLELMKVEFWRFSDVTCSAYPLTVLDTVLPDGSTNWDSAMMIIANGTTSEHTDMVESEVIQRLLTDKWKGYIKRKLFERLALLLVHLVSMAVAVYTRPDTHFELIHQKGTIKYVRYSAEIGTVLGCCFFIFWQQGGEVKSEGLYGFIRNLRNVPSKALFLIANISILLCVLCRVVYWQTLDDAWAIAEEELLVIALPASWAFLLFFARSILLTGPFVQMIYKMIAGDMIRFAIISMIFLISFSQAFFFVGKDMKLRQNKKECNITGYEITTFETFPETFISLFRASMGGYDYEEFDCAHYEVLTKLIFILYMVIMPIMLINMLIAMMGNTYTTVIQQAEKAWRKQWAQIVVALERSIKKENLSKFQLEYSIKLADATEEGGLETRGLMVIKQTKKTSAKQRKQATSNWKRIGRKVINYVCQHGHEKSATNLHKSNKVYHSTGEDKTGRWSSMALNPAKLLLGLVDEKENILLPTEKREISDPKKESHSLLPLVTTNEQSSGKLSGESQRIVKELQELDISAPTSSNSSIGSQKPTQPASEHIAMEMLPSRVKMSRHSQNEITNIPPPQQPPPLSVVEKRGIFSRSSTMSSRELQLVYSTAAEKSGSEGTINSTTIVTPPTMPKAKGTKKQQRAFFTRGDSKMKD